MQLPLVSGLVAPRLVSRSRADRTGVWLTLPTGLGSGWGRHAAPPPRHAVERGSPVRRSAECNDRAAIRLRDLSSQETAPGARGFTGGCGYRYIGRGARIITIRGREL